MIEILLCQIIDDEMIKQIILMLWFYQLVIFLCAQALSANTSAFNHSSLYKLEITCIYRTIDAIYLEPYTLYSCNYSYFQ